MFEKLFGKEEQPAPEIKEPGAPDKKVEALTDNSGAVLTPKEANDERKANWEDPTRRYDLK